MSWVIHQSKPNSNSQSSFSALALESWFQGMCLMNTSGDIEEYSSRPTGNGMVEVFCVWVAPYQLNATLEDIEHDDVMLNEFTTRVNTERAEYEQAVQLRLDAIQAKRSQRNQLFMSVQEIVSQLEFVSSQVIDPSDTVQLEQTAQLIQSLKSAISVAQSDLQTIVLELDALVASDPPEWVEPKFSSNLNRGNRTVTIIENEIVLKVMGIASGFYHSTDNLLISGQKFDKNAQMTQGASMLAEWNDENGNQTFTLDAVFFYHNAETTLFLVRKMNKICLVRSDNQILLSNVVVEIAKAFKLEMNSS